MKEVVEFWRKKIENELLRQKKKDLIFKEFKKEFWIDPDTDNIEIDEINFNFLKKRIEDIEFLLTISTYKSKINIETKWRFRISEKQTIAELEKVKIKDNFKLVFTIRQYLR